MFLFGLNITATWWTTVKIVDALDLSLFLKLWFMIFQFFMFFSIRLCTNDFLQFSPRQEKAIYNK